MRTKKGEPDFNQSEPAFLISCMDRHNWAVVVCLVGNGQEINRGEAGIREWLSAVSTQFPNWVVHLSPELANAGAVESEAISALEGKVVLRYDPALHLATSVRSFRSEHVSSFVNDLLDLRLEQAKHSLKSVLATYPIRLTRDLAAAKHWVRTRARGSERFGMVVSSGAQRLRPLGVDVRVKTDPVQWFLQGHEDVRSSYYMEDPATEFQVQGLELDWACVVWDADLRAEGGSWGFHKFSGSSWKKVNDESRRRYLLNAYRVLLTRARQGMVIVIPTGSDQDKTRPPKHYDGVFDLLKNLGIPLLTEENG